MKPFNLKEALEGKPVITRTGEPVTQLFLFDCEDNLPLMGVLNNELHSFTKEGKWSFYKHNVYDADLFMASEEKQVFINIYKDSNGYLFTTIQTRKDKADLEIEDKEISYTFIKQITTEI